MSPVYLAAFYNTEYFVSFLRDKDTMKINNNRGFVLILFRHFLKFKLNTES